MSLKIGSYSIGWGKLSTIGAALVAFGTIAAAMGYGFPWTSAEAGQTINRNLNAYKQSTDQQIQTLITTERIDNKHVSIQQLRTQRTVLFLVLQAQVKAHDTLSARDTQAQIDDTSAELRSLGSR